MPRLFVSDIDGCLAQPYTPYDLGTLQQLATLVARTDEPAFTLCSGRPYGYVEAMTQVLGVRRPALFESGGGCFDPVTKKTHWHPHFTEAVREQMEAARRWMASGPLEGTSLKLDHEKHTQAGVVGPDEGDVRAVLPAVEDFVARAMPQMRVFYTPVSIDVVAPTITKREGLAWLADLTGCPLSAMAYIGDTGGDLGALEAVGLSFAPANAEERVRHQVDRVTRGAVATGTLEAFRYCLDPDDASDASG